MKVFPFICLMGSTLFVHAFSPSFDCEEAQTVTEGQICKNEGLADLDQQLSRIYKKVHQNYPENEKNSLITGQKEWLEVRDYCGAATDCIERRFEERISELQIMGGSLVVPESVIYKCSDVKKSVLTVFFYAKAQIPTVVMNQDSAIDAHFSLQDTMYISPAGSGEKYVNESLEFWAHQGEAILTRKGKTINCKEFKK